MKNKLIFVILVFVLLFGLIFIISKNRNAREKERIEEKILTDRAQFVQDSLQNIQANDAKSRTSVLSETGKNKSGGNSPTEDFGSYLNASITNTSSIDIAVTVVDENGNIASSISSSIANIYTQTGNNGKTGLIRSSFLHKSGFQELFEGNSEIIGKLKLNKHADYVAIGKISYSIRPGTSVNATFVCTVSLTMNIISANQKCLVKSFTCSANGNGTTEDQAKKYAIDKLLNKYISEYSSI
jgi:hypothetical protein